MKLGDLYLELCEMRTGGYEIEIFYFSNTELLYKSLNFS